MNTFFSFTFPKTRNSPKYPIQCCIDRGVLNNCLYLCYGLDNSDDESNEDEDYDMGSCKTYVEQIEFCQNQ